MIATRDPDRIMRIAVLADIHGNLPALRAVLRDIDADPVDAIVVAGDAVGGPLARPCLDLLDARHETLLWVAGNSEREAVAAYDGAPVPDGAPGQVAAWSAAQLDRGWRDRLAGWPTSLQLDGIRFCHGSPRSVDEIITSETPDEIVRGALAGVRESLVVGAHTHRQVLRAVSDRQSYANAGSVGLPYEGRAGAFWLTVTDGVVHFRETQYDVEAAVSELAASGFAGVHSLLGRSLIRPVDPREMALLLESRAGRGRAGP